VPVHKLYLSEIPPPWAVSSLPISGTGRRFVRTRNLGSVVYGPDTEFIDRHKIMKDTNNISRLSRLTAILTLLQSKKIMTAAELAYRFEVSKRTIYRDIKALESAEVPIYSIEGIGYSLVRGYSLPPIMFTEEEANALITAENLVARNKDKSFVENHQSAITKVKATLRSSNKDKVEILSERVAYLKNFSEETTSNCLSSVQIALTNLKLFKINYTSGNKQETTTRTIEPQALYHTQENWILIAWCRLRNDYREFRLDRIIQFEVLNEHFDNRNFELMAYFDMIAKRGKW